MPGADGSEYLMVVSEGLDAHGEWLPCRVEVAQTLPQLKQALRHIVASGGSIVIQGAGRFGRLAQELGLQLLTSEWGKL